VVYSLQGVVMEMQNSLLAALDERNRIQANTLPFFGLGSLDASTSQPMGMSSMPMATGMSSMPMATGMSSMGMQPYEFGIVDPTYLAQLELLNQASMGMPQQAPLGLLGSGLEQQTRLGGLVGAPMIYDWRTRVAAPVGDGGVGAPVTDGGGGGADSLGGFGSAGGSDSVGNVGGGNIGGVAEGMMGPSGFGDEGVAEGMMGPSGVGDTGFGGVSAGSDAGVDGTSAESAAAAAADAGFGDTGGYSDAPASTDGFGDSDGGGGGGGGSKIICTAMNQAYGFGSFRNAIWIAYSDKHLTKAHEVGYHAIFLPLVDFGFKRGDGKLNMAVRRVMEWGTRHRSTDLRAEMRGTKRDTTGRVIRMIFEPLCYAVGKLKGY